MKEYVIDNLGSQLHYWIREGESNEWLFFLHGAGLDHHMFESQYAVIPKRYNILAWDARGHSKSTIKSQVAINYRDMIDDVRMICKAQHIDSATFIGQSMGGFLAQDVAYFHPELVKSLILIDCARNTNKLSKLEKIGLKLQPYMLKAQPEPIFLVKSAQMCGKHKPTVDFAYQKMRQLGKERLVETLVSLRQAFHEDKKYQSHCPITLICGKEDKVGMIIKAMKTWRKKDKSVYQTVWVKNAGHCANQDNAKPVNQAILKHLNKFLA